MRRCRSRVTSVAWSVAVPGIFAASTSSGNVWVWEGLSGGAYIESTSHRSQKVFKSSHSAVEALNFCPGIPCNWEVVILSIDGLMFKYDSHQILTGATAALDCSSESRLFTTLHIRGLLTIASFIITSVPLRSVLWPYYLRMF